MLKNRAIILQLIDHLVKIVERIKSPTNKMLGQKSSEQVIVKKMKQREMSNEKPLKIFITNNCNIVSG